MTEYNKLARGSFISNGVSQTIYLPFLPGTVDIFNIGNAEAQTQLIPIKAHWDRSMPDNTGITEYLSDISALEIGYIEDNGLQPFARSISDVLSAPQQVIAATKGSPTTSFNVATHGFVTGTVVVFEGLYAPGGTTGMPQMCGIPMSITVVDENNFTVQWNTNQSNYTSLTSSPAGAYVRQVLYPNLYSPGVEYIIAIGLGLTTTIFTTTISNCKPGQTITFRIPPPWGTVQLNSGNNPYFPGFPVYATVVSVGSNVIVTSLNSVGFTQFTLNVPVYQVPGLTPAQVLSVGDNNTGGGPVLATSQNGQVIPTVNGPAITGSFANNTAFGVTMGTNFISSSVNSSNNQLISWTAAAYDYVSGT